MKKFTLILISCLPLFARAQQKPETIFKENTRVTGAYGAVYDKFSSIDGSFAHFLGGYGGVVFNQKLLVGAGAYTLLNKTYMEGKENTNGDYLWRMTAIGSVVEYTPAHYRAAHFSFHCFTGVAVTGLQTPEQGLRTKGRLLIEPAVHGELNLTAWCKTFAGVSYRLVQERVFSAPSLQFGFKFGSF